MVMKPRLPVGRQAANRPRVGDKVETPDESMLERIESELEKDGVKLFGNDNVEDDYLELPRDITDIEMQELGRYLNAFTQQKMWSRTLIGRVTILAKEEDRKLNKIKDRVYSSLPVKLSVKEKELRLANHEECQALIEQLDLYQQRLLLLGDYLENLEDGIFNISREISRRSADFNNEKRDDNVGKGRGFKRR